MALIGDTILCNLIPSFHIWGHFNLLLLSACQNFKHSCLLESPFSWVSAGAHQPPTSKLKTELWATVSGSMLGGQAELCDTWWLWRQNLGWIVEQATLWAVNKWRRLWLWLWMAMSGAVKPTTAFWGNVHRVTEIIWSEGGRVGGDWMWRISAFLLLSLEMGKRYSGLLLMYSWCMSDYNGLILMLNLRHYLMNTTLWIVHFLTSSFFPANAEGACSVFCYSKHCKTLNYM